MKCVLPQYSSQSHWGWGSQEMQSLEVHRTSVPTPSASHVEGIAIRVTNQVKPTHFIRDLQTVLNTCKYLSWAISFCIVANIE